MPKNFQQAIEAYNSGNVKKAIRLLSKIKHPSFNENKLKLQLLYKAGQFQEAVKIGQILLNQTNNKIEYKDILFFTGICLSKTGNKQESISHIERCIAIDSSASNAVALYNLACLYYQEGYFYKAKSVIKKISSLIDYSAKAKFLIIKISVNLGDKDLVITTSRKLMTEYSALTIEEIHMFARYLIGSKQFDLALLVIKYIKREQRVAAIVLLAELYSQQKKFREVEKLCDTEISAGINDVNLYYLQSNAFDKLGQYERAFTIAAKAALIKKKEWDEFKQIDYIPNWNKYVDKRLKLAKLNKSNLVIGNKGNIETINVAFIFSFPRSGTTLLDNILDTQSDISVLSEAGVIPRLVQKATSYVNKFPINIDQLSCEQLEQLRSYYWELVQQLIPNMNNKQLVVDKGPHHTELLPFLQLVFPNATFIAAIRHPLDVCLSCFQQNFEFNNPNSFLTSIDDIVQRYKQVFNLLERYRSELFIPIVEVRYEDVVNDFDETLSKLFDVLNIIPKNDYKNFHKHAEKKYITSASRGQTDKALYKSSSYKYKNYHDYLTKYAMELNSIMGKLGYNFK